MSAAGLGGNTDRRNAVRFFLVCPIPIDQRRLTDGDYDLRAMAAVEPTAIRTSSVGPEVEKRCYLEAKGVDDSGGVPRLNRPAQTG